MALFRLCLETNALVGVERVIEVVVDFEVYLGLAVVLEDSHPVVVVLRKKTLLTEPILVRIARMKKRKRCCPSYHPFWRG